MGVRDSGVLGFSSLVLRFCFLVFFLSFSISIFFSLLFVFCYFTFLSFLSCSLSLALLSGAPLRTELCVVFDVEHWRVEAAGGRARNSKVRPRGLF